MMWPRSAIGGLLTAKKGLAKTWGVRCAEG
jgi:hypothetical protein